MDRILKFVCAVLLLGFAGTAALAQEKDRIYYSAHESEIFPDAEAAFRNGDYERALELCEWYSVYVGGERTNELREKARRCSKLTIEMNAFLSIGQRSAAKDKAQDIVAININDEAAWRVIRSDDDDIVVDRRPEEAVPSEDEAIPFSVVEVKPSFNGGDANEFSRWVNSQLVYPEIAKQNGVQGRVTLQFTVEADGRVTNVKVLRSVDEALDREAVRVVSSSPRWRPGMQKGRPVRVTYTFPVIFQLR